MYLVLTFFLLLPQMLARSFASSDSRQRNVVESTTAIVFLGTPHRGSLGFAAIGERVRSLASGLGAQTSPKMLQALGLKTTDLERAQESFSGLWQKYDFRVKTFQEGLGLTGMSLGILGDKVVPDYSSLLGDQREHAETIQANHRDMCRFIGPDDPGYRKVAGELRSICLSIEPSIERDEARREEEPTMHLRDGGLAPEAPPPNSILEKLENQGGRIGYIARVATRHALFPAKSLGR